MQIESPAKERDVALPAIGSDALAEGLMLVRASTLKVVRFHLAMERQDRRVALEAVDDLVAIDRRLQDYLADVSVGAEQLLFRNALDDERNMLNHEKLALVAEVVRREPSIVEAPTVAAPDTSEEMSWDDFDFTPVDKGRPHRIILWFAIALAVLAATAGAAWMVVGPNTVAMVRQGGGLQ